MMNAPVRVAAEGMSLNRRTMMAATAATAITGPALAAMPSTELADLIGVHKAAYKRFSQIVEVEEERTAAYFDAHDTEILIPLSVGGARRLMLTWRKRRAEHLPKARRVIWPVSALPIARKRLGERLPAMRSSSVSMTRPAKPTLPRLTTSLPSRLPLQRTSTRRANI